MEGDSVYGGYILSISKVWGLGLICPGGVAVCAVGSACLLLAVSLTRAMGQLPEERLRHGV